MGPPERLEPGTVTWDQFLALPDDDRRELVDGRLEEIETPTELHERIVGLLTYFLVGWARSNGAVVLTSGYRVKVTKTRGAMPDLQLYRSGNHPPRGSTGLTSGRPDLAIEVLSESSTSFDRVTKLNWYASLGVPEYWIVDGNGRSIERFVFDGGSYRVDGSVAEEGSFAPPTFPGLAVPLAELFADPT